MGISIPQGGLWLSLLPLPQAERKASAGQWGRQHNISPFGVVHEHKPPPQNPPLLQPDHIGYPSGIQKGLQDKTFCPGSQRCGMAWHQSWDPRKTPKSTQSAGGAGNWNSQPPQRLSANPPDSQSGLPNMHMATLCSQPSRAPISFGMKVQILTIAHKVLHDLPPSSPFPHLPLSRSLCSSHTCLLPVSPAQ